MIRTQPDCGDREASLNYIYGSYNLNNFNVQVRLGKENQNTFPTHTSRAMDTAIILPCDDIVNGETLLKSSERQKLNAYVSYGDLYIRPCGLNLTEYNANPKAARPGWAQRRVRKRQRLPSTKTIIAGVSNTYYFSEHLENTTNAMARTPEYKIPHSVIMK